MRTLCSNRLISHVFTAGDDFDETSPLMQTFPSGSSVGDRVYFDIAIFDDNIVERDETFHVFLRETDDLIVHIKTSIVQISDYDSKSTKLTLYSLLYLSPSCPAACVNFSQSVYRVEESVGSVEVCVDLDGTIEDYLTVYLFTIPGTATGECTHLKTLEEVFINGSIDSL